METLRLSSRHLLEGAVEIFFGKHGPFSVRNVAGDYQRLPNRSATNFSASKIADDRLNKASAS
jgi:hypothetical protein